MKHTLRNYLMIVPTLLIRLPIVLILLLLCKIGEYAKKIYERIEHKLPSLEGK